eukprot:183775-Amorphochlora_amoeboformis.AAC.2
MKVGELELEDRERNKERTADRDQSVESSARCPDFPTHTDMWVYYRFFDMNTEVVLSANGSARLQLDHTDVLVAVK